MPNYIINPTFTDPSAIKGLTSAKGDILSGDASGGIFTTTVGGDGTVLTADSGATGGVAWAAAGSSITLSSAGGTETLVNDGTGPDLANKGLTAGTGISLGSDASSVTITNSSPASSVTLADVSGTGDETLVGDGTGPSLSVKKLTAGTGVSLSSDVNQVTITNSSPGSAVSLSNAGGDETLVNDGTGPALVSKGISAGTGISLGSTASAVTITNTLDTFVELSDTPANYTGDADKMLVVNGTPDAVAFSENLVGTNTDTTGSSIAIGGSSSVGGNTSAIAIGDSSTVSSNTAIALGANASNDTSDTLTITAVPMINNTSATGTSLTAIVYPGTNDVIATSVIDLEAAGATITIDLPTNTRMLVDRIDVMKLDAAVTGTTVAATYSIGITGTDDAFVTTQTLNDTDTENAQYERATFHDLARTAATDSLTFTYTQGTYTGAWTVRVFFEGKLVRDE